jgi:hypothetical protein
MADREPSDRKDRPVLSGLLALVGVALVVGLIVGLAALAGTRILGLDADEAAAENTGGQSLFLPKPKPTQSDKGPQITLSPGPSEETEESDPSETKSSKEPKKVISLSASQTEVAPMEQIDLTGVYPGGEGAILRVERFANGGWEDFAQITANVSNETFSTYIQTGQIGMQRFRMVDTDTGKTSNEVQVRVG